VLQTATEWAVRNITETNELMKVTKCDYANKVTNRANCPKPPLLGDKEDINGVTYLLTYLLTPWCRVLLEKLPGLQLVKKLPAFHGTRRFITALTSVRHLSQSWASPILSIYPHPTSLRSIPILSTHLRLGLPGGVTAN